MLAQHASGVVALSGKGAAFRTKPLARGDRRVAPVCARLAAKGGKGSSEELTKDLFSIVRKARPNAPLVEESKERVDELLKELLRFSARSPARNPALLGSYQLLYSSRATVPSSFLDLKKQVQSYEKGGIVVNNADFAIAGLLPGRAQQSGRFKPLGPDIIEVKYESQMIDKGFLGTEEKEISGAQGLRNLRILYLGQDALICESLLSSEKTGEKWETPTLLVFQRVQVSKIQDAVKGTVQVQKKKPMGLQSARDKKAAIPMMPKSQNGASMKAEKAALEKQKREAKLKAEKEAKLKLEREAKAARQKAEQQKREAKLRAEQEARETAREAERLRREKEAAMLQQRQLKEQIDRAIGQQNQEVAKAQAASMAAMEAVRAAERDAQPVLRDAAEARRKIQAAEAATARAVEEAERAVAAKEDADEGMRAALQEIRKLQQRAKAL